jgi:hypothetical protein
VTWYAMCTSRLFTSFVSGRCTSNSVLRDRFSAMRSVPAPQHSASTLASGPRSRLRVVHAHLQGGHTADAVGHASAARIEANQPRERGNWLRAAPSDTPVSSVGRAPARQAGGHWFEPSAARRKACKSAFLVVWHVASRPRRGPRPCSVQSRNVSANSASRSAPGCTPASARSSTTRSAASPCTSERGSQSRPSQQNPRLEHCEGPGRRLWPSVRRARTGRAQGVDEDGASSQYRSQRRTRASFVTTRPARAIVRMRPLLMPSVLPRWPRGSSLYESNLFFLSPPPFRKRSGSLSWTVFRRHFEVAT